MKKIIILFIIALALSVPANAAIPGPETFLAPEVPPENALQVLGNADFEEGYVPWGWLFRMDADLKSDYAYSGMHSAYVGGPNALGRIEQELYLADCEPGDTWVHVAYDILPSSGPWPEDAYDRDTVNGWITDEDLNMVVWFMKWTDRRAFEDPPGFKEIWWRIDEDAIHLFDKCWIDRCEIKLGVHTDDDPRYFIDVFIDDAEFWCTASWQPYEHFVYLPAVSR